MKAVKAIGKYVVCILKKAEEPKKGILIMPEEKKVKIYMIYDSGESNKVKDGDKVFLNGYAQPFDHESETFYIVQEEHVAAILS